MSETEMLAAELPSLDLPNLLRRLAQDEDDRAATLGDVGRVWHALRRRDAVVVDTFYSQERWFALLEAHRQGNKASSPRRLELLESLLLGQRQKVTAMECGIGLSTVSLALHRALEDIGVVFPPRSVPPILMLLVRAGVGSSVPPSRLSSFTHAARDYWVVSVERPEACFRSTLPSAEYQVLCRLVEGHSYAAIARERRTSVRTVANQVSSIFHRLQVSGRSELISTVIARAVDRVSRQSQERKL